MLTLRNNKLGFEGAAYIGQSNLTNLTSLEISNNHIEDKGFTFLVGSKSLTNLTLLNVENNNIFGGEMLRYKGDIALKNLTSLYVLGNGKRFLGDKKVILDSMTEEESRRRIEQDREGAGVSAKTMEQPPR